MICDVLTGVFEPDPLVLDPLFKPASGPLKCDGHAFASHIGGIAQHTHHYYLNIISYHIINTNVTTQHITSHH